MEVYENTWKCGELKLYFSPSAGGLKKIKKKSGGEMDLFIVYADHNIRRYAGPVWKFWVGKDGATATFSYSSVPEEITLCVGSASFPCALSNCPSDSVVHPTVCHSTIPLLMNG